VVHGRPKVLAIHAEPHANPKVRRVGFALDDPYVEQVWGRSHRPLRPAGPTAPARVVAQARTGRVDLSSASAHVAPLSARQLSRVPEWTRQVHDRLLGTHLDRLALGHTDPSLHPDRSLDTARITARLDHLQHRRPAISRGLGLQP
jgi:hypothetical protein